VKSARDAVDALVLGSSGYIGRHLTAALADRRTIAVSRAVDEGPSSVPVDLSAAPLPGGHRLFGLAPASVFVLARPAAPEHGPNRIFHDNLQRLLLAWSEGSSLGQVDFTSTTMVYPGTHPGPEPADSPRVAPYGLYEYFKLETELFLRYLSTVRPDLDVRVWRLPIAFGGDGDLRALAEAGQFLPYWIDAYMTGRAWRFETPEDATFGTSWFDLSDFVATLAKMTREKGQFRIANVASGFFTYRELHDVLTAALPGPHEAGSLHLPRTRFEVHDEMRLPGRDVRRLAEAITRACERANAGRPESGRFVTVESAFTRRS
jgi:nucleoside-diphosphate-sugar epimerase